MSPDRWQELTELFDDAWALAEDDREAFLAERAADSPDLRELIMSLLEAGQVAEAGSFLERHLGLPSPGGPPSEVTPGTLPLAGDALGPYRVVEEIGRGGMGVVYLAERDDGAFERQVAIKLIRQERPRDDARRRMQTEQQILAALDHPGIAALHDGGTTADGQPYFVMEYVDGVPIDVYCDQRRLGLDERIRLLLQVCDAMELAHRNLIVHRDLKPSNILVTPEGHVKLLDFGIAKWLEPENTTADIEATEPWLRPLTRGYASPEQMQGRIVTLGSDVYSLGVLLYKLMTGRLPFRFEDGSFAEVLESMLADKAPRASEVARGGRSDR